MTGGQSGAGPAPRRRGDIIAVELDGEAVLYDPRSGNLHKLNTAGSVLWRCLDGDVTVAQLAAEVAAETGQADVAAVERQLAEYVAQLAGLGLLEGSD